MTRRTLSHRVVVGLASLGLLTSFIGPSVAVAAPLDPITISAASHDFGDQEVGSSSGSVTFTITNNTDATAHYVSRTTSGTNDFTLFSDTCEGDLAALATCDVNMQFNPSVEGPLTGSTSHEWDLGSAAAYLTGNGIVTPAPIIPQLTIDILITSKVIDLDPGTMTLGLDAQPNRAVAYTYWATPTIGATIIAGSTHTTVIDCATLPGMVYAMVDDPLGNPLNEASDMVLVEACVPTPTDLATILILNHTTVDFGANTRMVFVSNEVNGGISPYTYMWDRSNGDGLVTGTRDQTFTFDCSLLPTTIVGQATDANSDQVTDSLTVDACGDAPVSEPLTVVIPTPTPQNAPLPATDSIGAAERSIGTGPIVPIWIFIVVVVGLVALPSRRTRKTDR